MTGGTVSAPTDLLTISDHGALNSYKVNSPAGEYGILYTSSVAAAGTGVGLVYYQAGICVLTASIFDGDASNYIGPNGANNAVAGDNQDTVEDLLVTGSISGSADALRNRLHNISFNNTIENNSTIYFCRAGHSDFNYSSNPTYLSESKIRVKTRSSDTPVSYITTVGLYSADNELLAVAKLSEPLKKDPTNEITLRVRLDY